jgi:hypothetical protein
MKFLEKLQSLPLKTRKVILWSIIVIVGLTLLFFWLGNIQKTIKGFEKKEIMKEINLPPLKEEFKEIPKVEIPEISQEELLELERQLRENEK